jgi:hypothetical protein
MSRERYEDLLSQARQLSRGEQQRLAEELSGQSELARDVHGHHVERLCVDPREDRNGPTKTELSRKRRDLRKQDVQSGGRLLTMDEIDELVDESRGSLVGREYQLRDESHPKPPFTSGTQSTTSTKSSSPTVARKRLVYPYNGQPAGPGQARQYQPLRRANLPDR